MKILLFLLSIAGFFTAGYSIFQTLNGLTTYGEWLMLFILVMLFMISALGILLNYDGIKLYGSRVRIR